MNDTHHQQPQTTEEELVQTDDKIIGKAFRWSLIAVGCLSVLGVVTVFLMKHKTAGPAPQLTKISAPGVPMKSTVSIPETKFINITEEAGIHFVHQNGAYGDKLLPETMGGGVAFLDYDNDGKQDLLFVNSSYWPWHEVPNKSGPTMALYHNDGTGHFKDMTAGSGLDVSFYGMGVAAGDYDNDGLVDLFITSVGGNHLFHNEGNGKFKEVTSSAAVGGETNGWGTCAAWVDYDNDGKLDLFVGSYVKWSREIDAEVGYKIDGRTRAYGQPMNFEGSFGHLYHNDGNGRFSDVSEASGIRVKNPATGVPASKTLGVAPVDINGDGWMDLIVANDTVPNLLFINQQNGTFKEIGAASGIAFDSYGNTRGAMGIDTSRFRDDAKLAIGIGNFANEMTALYVAQNSSTNFSDEAITEGIGPASRLLLKFGLFFFDYDLDGRLDLLTANGHLEEEISKIQKSQQYAQPAQLFWNAGNRSGGSFLTVPPEKVGTDLFKPVVGRGSAFGDIDGDGDPDIVITQVGGSPLLLKNDQKLGHHWTRFKLVGTRSNRDAIGVWIKVRIKDKVLWRQVMPTKSYLSQSELPVTIGLDSASQPDEVTVVWPGNRLQKVEKVNIDEITVVTESDK